MASVALIIAFGTSISASADHRQLSASGVALDSISQEVISDIQATPSLFTCPYVYQNFLQRDLRLDGLQALSPRDLPPPSPRPPQPWRTLRRTRSSMRSPSSNTFANTCVAGQPLLVTISVTDSANSQKFTNSFVVDSPLDTVTGSQTTAIYGTASQVAVHDPALGWIHRATPRHPAQGHRGRQHRQHCFGRPFPGALDPRPAGA